MKKLIIVCAITFLISFVSVPLVFAVSISIPAESCIYFAGQSHPGIEIAYPPLANWELVPWDEPVDGLLVSLFNDAAPWEGVIRAYSDPAYSNVTARTVESLIPPFIDITSWETSGIKMSITATGLWGHHPVLFYHSGPDGYSWTFIGEEYTKFGISRLYAPYNSLVGVFLSDEPPNPDATPPGLTAGVDNMTTPMLQQAFVIGSNLENITIPSGATRLFFGLQDTWQWWNNDGDMDVTIIPEPGTILFVGLGGLALLRRRKRV